MKPTATSWGNVADWYDELLGEAGTYQKDLILPNLLRIIAPHKGQTIADIACGQGFFARAFAGAGARVLGTDISPELIAIAKKSAPRNALFRPASADKLAFIKNGEVDVAVIVLAIQNIENLGGAVAETARIVKPGGRFILVMNHPAFRIPKHSSWGWDETAKQQYRRLDGYMSETRTAIDMHPSRKNKKGAALTVSFHRPLQVYVKTLVKAGFAITRLEEWTSPKTSEPGPRAREENRLRKEIPLFLCLEARRPG